MVAGSGFAERIVQRARELGASSAGLTTVSLLRDAPSYRKTGLRIHSAGARSVLVLALRHDQSQPELDWWDRGPGGNPGNRRLMEMAGGLRRWLKDELGIEARALPYAIESGGIFLKDAAALAGLGVVGKNNLLVTPELGPRVRLRALFLHANLEPTPAAGFDPCSHCPAPCRQACPRQAFGPQAEAEYTRAFCDRQMASDVSNAVRVEPWEADGRAAVVVKYCRACELSCCQGAGER